MLIRESSFCTVTGDETWVNHAASATIQPAIHDKENPKHTLSKQNSQEDHGNCSGAANACFLWICLTCDTVTAKHQCGKLEIL